MSIKKSEYLVITGDLVPSKEVATAYNENGLDEFNELFQNAKEVIVNLEAPITECESKSLKAGPSLKVNRSDCAVLNGLNTSIACLANNHICDYGVEGLRDTISYLNEQKIKSVGAKLSGTGQPYINVSLEGKKVTIFNFCENEFCYLDKDNHTFVIDPIDNFSSLAKVESDFKVVILHAGTEHHEVPNPWHRKVSKYFIDIGADLVISHHTHINSAHEVYKGKNIYYGIGNFLFSKPQAPSSWYISSILKVYIDNGVLAVTPILAKQMKNKLLSSLQPAEQEEFEIKQNVIKSLLVNDVEYEKSWDKYSKENLINYTAAAIGMSRIERGIYRKIKLKLPTYEKEEKLLRLSNYINCESHRILLKKAITELTNHD